MDGGREEHVYVVVPERPGPLVQLAPAGSRHGDRDELDEVLDELFGEDDDRGPGLADAALVAAGAAGIAMGVAADIPVATVAGAVAVGLGLVLPTRTLWRRVRHRRVVAELQRRSADGTLLRADAPGVRELVAAYDALCATLVAPPASAATVTSVRILAAGHAALCEAATLLRGRAPDGPAEREYVEARARAVADLAALAQQGARDRPARTEDQARLDARLELEEVAGGSALTDATDLIEELRGHDDT